jgi:hypothetical protein
MKINANPRDIDIEDDSGRTWGIDVHDDNSLRLYAWGLTEDSAARFREDQFAPEIELRIKPEQAPDVLAALTVWLEQLC